jgi:hypothetical protein
VIFKNIGFLEYGQEEICQLDQSINRVVIKPALQLRPQQSSDGWGLQKLYASLTPRAVQNAEGLAQGHWDLPRWRWGGHGRRQGYIWEVDGELMGALHLRSGKRGYWIRTLLHPDALTHAEALGQAALKLTANKPDLPVYFAFRQYEPSWQHILPTLGFEPLTSQTLVVKPLAVRLREKSPALMPTLEASPTEGATPTLMSHAEIIPPKPQNGHTQRHGPRIFTFF